MVKVLKTPWQDNPSKPENFYEEEGMFEQFVSGEVHDECNEGEDNEEDDEEVIDEKLIEEVISEIDEQQNITVEQSFKPEDPYAAILNQLQ